MGIRPSMSLMIGINDLMVKDYEIVDPRWKNTQDDEWRDREVVLPALPEWEHGQDYTPEMEVQSRLNASVKCFFFGDRFDKASCELWEIIEHDSEYGVGNVMGFNVAELPYASEVLYALATLHPEYATSGYKTLPSIQLEDDRSQEAQFIKWAKAAKPDGYEAAITSEPFANRKWQQIQHGHNYGWFSVEIDFWLDGALWLFQNVVKLDLKREELKLILYWKWS